MDVNLVKKDGIDDYYCPNIVSLKTVHRNNTVNVLNDRFCAIVVGSGITLQLYKSSNYTNFIHMYIINFNTSHEGQHFKGIHLRKQHIVHICMLNEEK